MKYWPITCLAVGFVLGDEVIAWICLLLAAVPPVLRLAMALSREYEKEDSKYRGYIDEDGFYN